MSEPTTIASLVAEARQLADDSRTPFARTPWTSASPVIWREGESTARVTLGDETYEYFLEPSIIVDQFDAMLGNTDLEATIDRVIQYAINDA